MQCDGVCDGFARQLNTINRMFKFFNWLAALGPYTGAITD